MKNQKGFSLIQVAAIFIGVPIVMVIIGSLMTDRTEEVTSYKPPVQQQLSIQEPLQPVQPQVAQQISIPMAVQQPIPMYYPQPHDDGFDTGDVLETMLLVSAINNIGSSNNVGMMSSMYQQPQVVNNYIHTKPSYTTKPAVKSVFPVTTPPVNDALDKKFRDDTARKKAEKIAVVSKPSTVDIAKKQAADTEAEKIRKQLEAKKRLQAKQEKAKQEAFRKQQLAAQQAAAKRAADARKAATIRQQKTTTYRPRITPSRSFSIGRRR